MRSKAMGRSVTTAQIVAIMQLLGTTAEVPAWGATA